MGKISKERINGKINDSKMYENIFDFTNYRI